MGHRRTNRQERNGTKGEKFTSTSLFHEGSFFEGRPYADTLHGITSQTLLSSAVVSTIKHGPQIKKEDKRIKSRSPYPDSVRQHPISQTTHCSEDSNLVYQKSIQRSF